MGLWLLLLGPMITWTVHFFAGYVASITIYDTAFIRPVLALLSILCLAANAWLIVAARRQLAGGDDFQRWIGGGSLVLLILSSVGIVFQSFPILLA